MIFEVFFFFFFGMCYYSFSCFYSYFCLILILFLVLVVYASLNLHLALWVLYSPTAKWNIRMWQLWCVCERILLTRFWRCSVIMSPKIGEVASMCVYKQFECKKHFTLGALFHIVLRFLVLIFPSNQTKHNGKQQNSGDWSNWSIWTIHRQGS
ncbi:hypothetical protein CY35_13G104500 [Sphagnum magellanicum]|nr:hypothetical protein CY35_13G104500 [Sphagnum magellanicum]